MLLTWYFVQSVEVPEPAGDLEITPDLLSRFIKDLSDKSIHISGISGTWNVVFPDLLVPFEDPQCRSRIDTIFLASETIYSSRSIHAFTQVLLKALECAEETHGRARALVAAKKFYFGVGGGVDEFLKVLSELGGKGVTTWESKDEGVGRVIMEVQRASGGAAKWWASSLALQMKKLIPCRNYASFALLQAPSTHMWNTARLSCSPFLGSSLYCMVHLRMTGCYSLYSVIHQSFALCILIMTNLLLSPTT